MNWKAAYTHIAQNWRTSVQGLLGGYLSIFSALTGADFAGVGQFHYAKWFLISGVAAKSLLGFIQSDAKPKLPTT